MRLQIMRWWRLTDGLLHLCSQLQDVFFGKKPCQDASTCHQNAILQNPLHSSTFYKEKGGTSSSPLYVQTTSHRLSMPAVEYPWP